MNPILPQSLDANPLPANLEERPGQSPTLASTTRMAGCLPRFAAINAYLGRFTIPLRFTCLLVGLFGILRLAMFLWFAGPRAANFGEAARMLWTGVQFDVLAALVFALPQAIVLGLAPERWIRGRCFKWGLQLSWLLGFLSLPFLCLSEWLFFEEFQSRLNYIAFEYLAYPSEVCCNIWQSYPIPLLVGLVLGVGSGLFLAFRGPFLRSINLPLPWPRRLLLLGTYLAATAGLWLATSMDDMQVSDNRMVNECANTGLYSFVYYVWTCRFDFNQLYLTLDEQEAVAAVQSAVFRAGGQRHLGSFNPLDRLVRSDRPRKDYNVVLILEESLGADFIGVLGNTQGLSPHFDELSERGLLFDNFHATGNRTARALEAVLTSLPPLPTESILKRDHSDHVYTLANVLAARGYHRLFMTGGRGLFDGVKSFMTSNGFDEFIEQADYESPVFTNAWGVSDEDLFGRALTEFDRLHQAGRPFFSLLLTVSNHRPYTYPQGRIPEQEHSRVNAVKYADWALGEFFRRARLRAFYKNTIFVVMGDHGARVYGAQSFPVKSYRVPLLVIHPERGFAGRRSHALGCSMDIAPTILGLLGGSYRSTFFGQDVTRLGPSEGFALMQHNHDVALLEANLDLTVLSAGKNAWGYHLDPWSYRLMPSAFPKPASLIKTIAYFQTAYRLYYDDHCYPACDSR